jgi:hypothetical protein
MRHSIRTAIASVLALIGASASALSPGETVDNFRLFDQQGKSHELYYLSDHKAVVLVVQQNGCKGLAEDIAKLNEIGSRYAGNGVALFMLNPSAKDSRASVSSEMTRLGVSIPVLLDPLQLIGESLAATRAGEAFVIDPTGWKLVYRGPIDALAPALDATLSGGAPKSASGKVRGCKIAMPERSRTRAHAKISYERTIAPLLIDKCVTCHRQGGIGPWQMSSYTMVKGFAPMIREVVRTQRMPPWHADPHHGAFGNDRSLTAEQAETLVHWIEAGAPRGKGADPLVDNDKRWPDWYLGEPDLVLEIPAFDVPATGTIPYKQPVVKNPLGRDVWLRAIEFTPSDRSVVHHILAGTVGERTASALVNLEASTALGVYVPGDVPRALPENTGIYLRKDADFTFQIHYTANGKPTREVTRVGLFFAKEAPRYPLRNILLVDTALRIPAQTKEHQASARRTLPRDTLLYTLMAHSHVRGKSAKFTAVYPDGKEEVLLSVPHYDFNWQTSYDLAQPKLLPKGTQLIYSAAYDNSSQNKANPDPNVEVRWGQQTWEEMLYGDVRLRYVDETTDAQVSAVAN